MYWSIVGFDMSDSSASDMPVRSRVARRLLRAATGDNNMSQPTGRNSHTDPIEVLQANFQCVAEELTSHTTSPASEARAVSSNTSRFATAVADHPMAAIGLAFGTGFFLMRLLRRGLGWI
jgi:hypothetical protein